MRLDKIIAGIQILQPYYADPGAYHLGSEHDEIFMYETEKPVSAEDHAKLEALGWFINDADGWSAYT